jgi:hypothetical protein
LVELTPKECDQVTHKVKQFKWDCNVKALCNMLMSNWAILGFDGPTICFKYSNGGGGCNYRFNILFLGVWCLTKWGCHSTHLHFIYNLCPSWNLDFVDPLNLIMQHNQYVLVMIKQFLKWLKLVPSWIVVVKVLLMFF